MITRYLVHACRLALSLVALSLLGCNAGSNVSCADMGWSHEISLTLLPAISAGNSCEFQVVSDSLQESCNVSFSDAPQATCSDRLQVLSSSGRTTLDNIGIVRLTFGDGEAVPDSIELSVAVDNGTTVSRTITPDYQIDEPNGDGCEERKRATVVVDL